MLKGKEKHSIRIQWKPLNKTKTVDFADSEYNITC